MKRWQKPSIPPLQGFHPQISLLIFHMNLYTCALKKKFSSSSSFYLLLLLLIRKTFNILSDVCLKARTAQWQQDKEVPLQSYTEIVYRMHGSLWVWNIWFRDCTISKTALGRKKQTSRYLAIVPPNIQPGKMLESNPLPYFHNNQYKSPTISKEAPIQGKKSRTRGYSTTKTFENTGYTSRWF